MNNVSFIHAYTKDNLKLQGVHWESLKKDTCVVFTHGMSANIIENKFAHVLGDTLSDENIGFLYGHNRGHSLKNNIRTSEGKVKSIGACFEKFEECLYDIDLWVNECINMGYKNIILMGHSLGCNKVIHYMNNKNNPYIKAIFLASPPNMVESSKKNKHRVNMIDEAKKNINNNQPKKILSNLHGGWMEISSETFLQYALEGSVLDNLHKLLPIDIPLFALIGDHKEVNIGDPQEHLNFVKAHATNSPLVKTLVLKDANHNYIGKELEFSFEIVKWVNDVEAFSFRRDN